MCRLAEGPETQTPLERLHAQGCPTTQPVSTLGSEGRSHRIGPFSAAAPPKPLCKGRGTNRGRLRAGPGREGGVLFLPDSADGSGAGTVDIPKTGRDAGKDGGIIFV